MRGSRWLLIGIVAAIGGMTAGCSSSGPRRSVVTPEPALSGTTDADNATAPKTVSWVDRHPLFSKPRDYWESSGDNKIVKAAAATFVGVPSGMYNEVKQILVGVPQEPRY
jgi:hypothetical protein